MAALDVENSGLRRLAVGVERVGRNLVPVNACSQLPIDRRPVVAEAHGSRDLKTGKLEIVCVILTVYSTLVPAGLGMPGDLRGAESRTSGVNLEA